MTIWTLLLIIVLGLPVQTYGQTSVDSDYMDSILDIVEENYVEEIHRESIREETIKDTFDNLDHYSDYYTEKEFSDLIENLDGNFVGIGAYIAAEENYIKVVKPIKGSPAEKAGLLPGDTIITINGKLTKGMTPEEATNLIKGEAHTKVKLRFKSGNVVKIRDVKRQEIVIDPVSYKILEDIGYIKLEQFTAISYKNMVKALNHMDKNHINKIILDLRDNPGGYLDEVVQIAELFVPAGPIVHIKYKNMKLMTYDSYLGRSEYDLVVLVNENSSSASEILAGAVQDRNAGTLIGVTTFGKGTVQEILRLPKGDGMKLTVAEYFSPDKEKINGVGVTPDIIVENNTEEDLQLKTAIELLSN